MSSLRMQRVGAGPFQQAGNYDGTTMCPIGAWRLDPNGVRWEIAEPANYTVSHLCIFSSV
jgi:hypothetical protein